MTADQWLEHGQKTLKSAGIESARLDCLLLIEHASKKDQNWILTHGDKELTDEAIEVLDASLAKRAERYPLAYILGKKEFYGFDFYVDQSVLVPRPETEVMVTYITNNARQNDSLIDIGTGSGVIAVASKLMRPDLDVSATDTSSEALVVAKSNSKNMNAKVEFIKSDLFEAIESTYDVIAANLPYVNRHQKDLQPELKHEPEQALFSEDEGLALYDKFFEEVDEYLNDGGFIIVEHDPAQFDRILSFTRRQAHRVSDFVTMFS